jgi:hypothetical protein
MKRIALMPLAALSLAVAACGEQSLTQVCAKHGGRPAQGYNIRTEAHDHDRDGSPDGEAGSEANCADGMEVDIDQTGAQAGTKGWTDK